MQYISFKKTKGAPLLQALGQFIKHRRAVSAMSQEELALRSGLHRTYVSDVERGQRNLTIGACARLAKGLGLELVDLFLAVDQHDQVPSTNSLATEVAPMDSEESCDEALSDLQGEAQHSQNSASLVAEAQGSGFVLCNPNHG